MKVLVDATAIDPTAKAAISHELAAIERAQTVSDLRRRSLLAVLHMTRALDTSAKSIIHAYALGAPNGSALGPYLTQLTYHQNVARRRMPPRLRHRLEYSIVRPRNRLMHQADTYPTVQEERRVLADMTACLSVITQL